MKKKLLFILPICLLVLGFSAIQTNANEVVDLDAVSSPQANQEIALDNLDGVDIKPSSIQGHKISAAKGGTGALMDYYDGIESNYFDFLLYYISQNQNDDGSFGINNTYEISTDIAFALNKTGKNSGIQYTNLIDYLVDSEVSNIRDMASKARVLFATGGNWQLVMDDIITQRNNFGWGIYPGYGVDLQTTMEVAYASHVTQYDPSNIIAGSLYITLENIPQDGALAYDGEANASYYLINKMLKYLKPFQGLSVSDNGITYYVNDGIASLQSYLETNYISDETSLLDTDDIIDQIMTYQTWQEYETQPIFQSELKGDFLNFQKTNGSFDNSIKTTYYALDSLGQPDLEITNITSTSSLINKETAIFEIGIDNNGYAGADDAVIHLFIDNFNPQWEIDLSASSVVIEPGHSVNISVSLPTTVSLMGDTDIKVYVENSDDIDYEDNWLNESFNFAAALDSSPALPVYYIAQDYNDAGELSKAAAKLNDSLSQLSS